MRQGRRELVRRIDRLGRRRAEVRFVDHRRVDRSPWPSIEPIRDGCSHEHRMHARQRPADQVDVRCGRAQAASLGVSEEGHDSIATNRHPDRSAGPLSSLFEPGGDAETRLLFGRADLEHEALRSGRDQPGRRVHRDQGLEGRSLAKPLPDRIVRDPLIHVSALSRTRQRSRARWHPLAVAARLTHPNAAPTLRRTLRSGSVTVPRPTAKESRCID